MTLSILEKALADYSTREEFDCWLVENERALSNFFFRLTKDDLNALKFDDFYYAVISNSSVYKEYHSTRQKTEIFDFFLNLLSNAAEKLAQLGLDSLAKDIIVDLPESASKNRLIALNMFSLVEDIRTSYFKIFPSVVEELDKSRTYEEGTIRPIVDVLVYFFSKAKNAFESQGMKLEVGQLKRLFQNKELLGKYPYLNHQILIDLANDLNPFELYPVKVIRDRLEPSSDIKELFNKINKEFFNHPNIDFSNDNLWGFSTKWILDEVLIRGRGDFTKNSGKITAKDKVLLYCFFNLKKHFFTSYAVFETVLSSLQKFFNRSDYKPVFVDLGCGPMTSGLALADLIHKYSEKPLNFSYIGVDISIEMLSRAESFKNLPIFSPESSFKFVKSWNDIEFSYLSAIAGSNNPIIFNASYLFASSSLSARELCTYIKSVASAFSNVFLVFQNPNNIDRNLKYEEFKKCIDQETLIKKVENISYKAASKEANEDVYYEILKF